MINRRLGYIIRDQEPLLMPATATVQEVSKAMREKRVGSALVIDEHQHLVGIFTGRDALRLLAQGKAGSTPLAQAMTAHPVTISPDATAIEALRIMCDGGFRHVPVVERGHIWGIVSRAAFKGQELDRLHPADALPARTR